MNRTRKRKGDLDNKSNNDDKINAKEPEQWDDREINNLALDENNLLLELKENIEKTTMRGENHSSDNKEELQKHEVNCEKVHSSDNNWYCTWCC